MALTLRVIPSKAGIEDCVMYEIVNTAMAGLPGYIVEYGDFDTTAIDEIIDGRNVTEIVVKVRGYDLWDAVREYCNNNGIRYTNLCG